MSADVTSAKIGPKLGKAVSSFEQANKQLLLEKDYASILSYDSNAGYISALNDFLGGAVSGSSISTKTGVRYDITYIPGGNMTSRFHHNNYCGTVNVSINPARGNVDAENYFYFGLFCDGSLRPKGGSQSWNNADGSTWKDQCRAGATPSAAGAQYCAGHIFENNMKVLYK